MLVQTGFPGSKTADTRAALVEHFREQGKVMIATEVGAEGINLQFCSLVINYDPPWNPQRVEQRIAEIYERCRDPETIRDSFHQLQVDLAGEISESKVRLATSSSVFEYFDEQVLEK